MKTAAMIASESSDVESDDVVPSAGDSFEAGPGAGAELFAAQWQAVPREHWPSQQLVPAALAPQQPARRCEPAVAWRQHDGSVRDSRSQFGHAASGFATRQPRCPSVNLDAWFPQSQTLSGKPSTGISTAASQTMTLAAVLSWNCTLKLLHWLGIHRI
ncbi:MAG: hypothetical protein ACYC3X_00550 [Pirellulaceae bacterium]